MIGKILSFLAIFGLFYGCSTIHQDLDPQVYYKRDMEIRIDGKTYNGTAVLANTYKNEIEFKSAGRLDLFTFTTCHREYTQEEADSFFNKNKIKFEYKPVTAIELSGYCPIKAAGYDIKGKHSWAFLDIQTDKENLYAYVKCNGKEYLSHGVTICQSKYGLEQALIFDSEIEFMPEKANEQNCQKIEYEIKYGKQLIYRTPKKECVYAIKEKNSEKLHRLTTIGYEKILIREL